VADGLGGHQAGEVASALSVEAVEAFVLELRRFSRLRADEHGVIHDLREAVCQADARILQEAASRPELEGMGTTLTLAFASGDQLFVAHAGDSRCYPLHKGELYRLTEDHTLVAEMARKGEIGQAEARRHPAGTSSPTPWAGAAAACGWTCSGSAWSRAMWPCSAPTG
jgi:protein phosphatase